MAVNRLGQSMVGRSAAGKPNPGVNIKGFNVGKKAGKAKSGKGSGKSQTLANGTKMGVMKSVP